MGFMRRCTGKASASVRFSNRTLAISWRRKLCSEKNRHRRERDSRERARPVSLLDDPSMRRYSSRRKERSPKVVYKYHFLTAEAQRPQTRRLNVTRIAILKPEEMNDEQRAVIEAAKAKGKPHRSEE